MGGLAGRRLCADLAGVTGDTGHVNTAAPSDSSGGEDRVEEELVEPRPLFPLREVR